VFACKEHSLDENKLLDRVHSEEAQQVLSRLMFEKAGPELLYPVEWWTAFIKGRQTERTLGELSRKIAEAERSGDVEVLRQLLTRKGEANRRLAQIKREMREIPVDTIA
jgi:hypothetical protein